MPAPKEVTKRQALQSWKEIAAFLGVTVRSVQRWESAGLPVYRQGSGHRLTPAETASLGDLASFAAAPDGNSFEVKRLWKY